MITDCISNHIIVSLMVEFKSNLGKWEKNYMAKCAREIFRIAATKNNPVAVHCSENVFAYSVPFINIHSLHYFENVFESII